MARPWRLCERAWGSLASRMLTGVKGAYANTVAMAYDTGGRKATESLTIAGQTYTTGTAYDTAGRVSQLTYPDGSVVARTYDSRNLLSTIALGGSNIDSRSFDAGGRLTSETLGNGQVVTRAYLTGDHLPALIANAAVGNYTYGWDANKNKTSETITGAMSGFSSSMAFDDQNRLTTWNRSSGDSQAWTLSPVNDWQSVTNNGTAVARTHGPTHEVLRVGSATIQHDSRGNMTVDEFGITRTYDADGKVSQAIVPAGAARGIEGTYTYQYDALNRRVRKTTGGSSPSDTIFAHTGEQILADYPAGTAAASPTAKYMWGSYIDELVCRVAGSQKLYPHHNQQFSITAHTDQTGTVVERYAYTPYGDLVTLDPTTMVVRTTSPLTRYTYSGREYDSETGTYHFRARPYSASLGRFPSHDPIMYPDGANTYAGWFAIRSTDPSGLADMPGTFRVLNQACSDYQRDDNGGGCCCSAISVSYVPTSTERASCNRLYNIAYVRTVHAKHYYPDHIHDWHWDQPIEDMIVVTDVNRLSGRPVWTDTPGGGESPGDYYYGGCPGFADTKYIDQSWEVCSVCEGADGTAKVLGCVTYGHKCTFQYQKFRVLPNYPGCGRTHICNVSCTRTSSGASGSNLAGSAPVHVPKSPDFDGSIRQ